MKKIFFRMGAVVLGLLGILLIVVEQSMLCIVAATILWIVSVAVWTMSSAESYNDTMDLEKCVDDMPKMPLGELCQRMQSVETPLGKPWICRMSTLRDPVLVYGPDETGSFIYGHYSGSRFYLFASDNADWLQPKPEDAWRLERVMTRSEMTGSMYEEVQLTGALEAFQQIFSVYAASGRVPDSAAAHKIFQSADKTVGKIYAFQEDFKLTGQRYAMIDQEGNVLYDIDGTWPLKTLRIYLHGEDTVVFRMTKRILHVMTQYDFYMGEDDFLGSFQKKVDFAHDKFTMDLQGHKLVMRSVATTLGANYVVHVDKRQIGTISQDLSLRIDNLLFDNMVVEVFDDEYTLLMAALGIMSAREKSRDRENNIYGLGKKIMDAFDK